MWIGDTKEGSDNSALNVSNNDTYYVTQNKRDMSPESAMTFPTMTWRQPIFFHITNKKPWAQKKMFEGFKLLAPRNQKFWKLEYGYSDSKWCSTKPHSGHSSSSRFWRENCNHVEPDFTCIARKSIDFKKSVQLTCPISFQIFPVKSGDFPARKQRDVASM